MKRSKTLNRRGFLRAAWTAAAAPYIIPSSALGKAARPSPGNRITVGCIGVGSRGTADMREFLRKPDAQVVAVCDVKANVLEEKRQLVDRHYENRGCKAYHDFRDLLAREDIDAVLVATPDHWHVLSSLAAVHAGKDVYMEKPMGLSLAEDQAMRQAVAQRNRVFQFGTQQRSDRHFRLACELVRNGKIGELRQVYVWAPGSVPGGPTTPVPVPPWLDYDLWLGPARYAPYTEDRCSNRYWWFISDYALGFIAGWGIHPLDIAYWGAADKMTGPWEIEGTAAFPSQGVCDTATAWNIDFTFGSGLKLNYRGLAISANTGKVLHNVRAFQERYGRTLAHGTAFEGSEGWVHVDRGGIDTHPKSLLKTEFSPRDQRLYQSPNHVRNFLDCVKSRKQTVCPVDQAVQADILCHVSDIAVRRKRKLTWDPKQERFPGDPEANRRLNRVMRRPWHL